MDITHSDFCVVKGVVSLGDAKAVNIEPDGNFAVVSNVVAMHSGEGRRGMGIGIRAIDCEGTRIENCTIIRPALT